MKKRILAVTLLLAIISLGGCGKNASGGEGQKSMIENIPAEEISFVPEWKELAYDEALAVGGEIVNVAEGTFAGSGAVWYTVRAEGMEYYFCEAAVPDGTSEIWQSAQNYAVVGPEYALKCGIKVGTAVEEVLRMYPDMAETDLSDGESSRLEQYGCYGFHEGAGYPNGWKGQFDSALLANVGYGEELPLYLALMIKEDKVAAITFYHPTAN